jgi:ribose transport system substrate-binding protein
LKEEQKMISGRGPVGSRKQLRFLVLSLALVALGALAVGCGGGGSSSSSGGGGGSTEAGGGSTGGGGSAEMKAAEALMKKVEDPAINVTTPIGKPIPEGETVVFLSCNLSTCQRPAETATEAAKVIGWNVKVLTDNLTPQSLENNVQTALNIHPAVVVNDTLDLSPQELKEFKAAGIKVIGYGNTPNPGYTVILRDVEYQEFVGRIDAATIVTRSDLTSGKVGWPNQIGSAAGEGQEEGLKKGLAEFCPECELEVYELPTALNTNLASSIANWMRANPEIDNVVLAIESSMQGLHGALQAAGLSDKTFTTQYATNAIVPFLQSGELKAAISPGDGAAGWLTMDTAIRLVLGLPTEENTDPEALVPALNEGTEVQAVSEGPANYEQTFEKLWGK